MKKIKTTKVFGIMLALVMVVALTACQTKETSKGKDEGGQSTPEVTAAPKPDKEDDNKEPEQGKEEESASDNLEGIITITGSTSVEKILLEMADEFMAYNPEVTVNYIGTGSSAGIEDTIMGVNDLGASSREVKESELEKGLEVAVFAYDGIALITHPNNPVSDLSLEQVSKIYSGEIKNWSEVGGNDANIIVMSREGASGTRGAFEELVGLKDSGITEDATIVEGNGNLQSAVSGNENAIGYVSFSFIDESVKALTIGGVNANADEVKAAKYSLSRPFLFVYKADSLTEQTKAFLEYIVTPEAQVAVENHGGIRID